MLTSSFVPRHVANYLQYVCKTGMRLVCDKVWLGNTLALRVSQEALRISRIFAIHNVERSYVSYCYDVPCKQRTWDLI